MKLPNRHRLATLSVVAILLAGISTGSLTLCDLLFLGISPQTGETIFATVPAGEDLTLAEAFAVLGRFILCDSVQTVPNGVYIRTNRDFRGGGPTASSGGGPYASVDLVASSSTPPGHYVIQYRQTGPSENLIGTCDLTIEPGNNDELTACFLYHVEVIQVGVPVTFWGYCSTGPIVQYRWWFNYNGNPNSTPDYTSADYDADHTYGTAGQRTVRLVVRDENGNESATTRVINVIGS